MAFGIYVHIPYCLQRCPYCDFATYEMHETSSPEVYVDLVLHEIRQKCQGVEPRVLDTLYFGGGTPSLVDPSLILAIISEFEKQGFRLSPHYEMTLEINPGTIDQERIQRYQDLGVNRYSVGAQTFNDALLKKIGRKHSATETIQTLELLAKNSLNYSLDILFALPHQSRELLEHDLNTALKFQPPHISAYYLTVPDHHPLSKDRPLEAAQVEMFEQMESGLTEGGYTRYEISNYSLPGKESQHNWLYWSDQDYWGLGLSSHSFLKDSTWGTRFWNPPTMKSYESTVRLGDQVRPERPYTHLPKDNVETLKIHQAITDFCHTHLRTLKAGLTLGDLRDKFPGQIVVEIESRLSQLTDSGLLESSTQTWNLSKRGRVLADRVFEALTFLHDEIPSNFK